MQRRLVQCVGGDVVVSPTYCNTHERPPHRQECYNDKCKGVWRTDPWSEVSHNYQTTHNDLIILLALFFFYNTVNFIVFYQSGRTKTIGLFSYFKRNTQL